MCASPAKINTICSSQHFRIVPTDCNLIWYCSSCESCGCFSAIWCSAREVNSLFHSSPKEKFKVFVLLLAEQHDRLHSTTSLPPIDHCNLLNGRKLVNNGPWRWIIGFLVWRIGHCQLTANTHTASDPRIIVELILKAKGNASSCLVVALHVAWPRIKWKWKQQNNHSESAVATYASNWYLLIH